jgi:hypothetical protein
MTCSLASLVALRGWLISAPSLDAPHADHDFFKKSRMVARSPTDRWLSKVLLLLAGGVAEGTPPLRMHTERLGAREFREP